MNSYRKLFLFLLWIGLLTFPLSAFAKTTAQHGIGVSITLSSDAATIDDEITASFDISGGSGVFTRICGVWNVYDSRTKCTYQIGGASYNELTGSSAFIPKYGDKLYFQLEGMDSDGNPFLAFSDEILIEGVAAYPDVGITLSSDKAILDQEISASFEVTGGSGVYSRVYGVWNVFDSVTNCSYQFGSQSFETSTGDSVFIPSFGDYLYFQVGGQDSEGVPFLAYSEKIDIIGEVDYPSVEIRLSSDIAMIGEEISAEFEVTGGSGMYNDLYGVWNVYDNQTNCSYQLGGTEFEGSSGRASFTPGFGDKLFFQVEGKDSKGVSILSLSDEISITALHNSDELGIPGNVSWDSNSAVIVVWDAVNGADYYSVNVIMCYHGKVVGTCTTETTDIFIDALQAARQSDMSVQHNVVDLAVSVAAVRIHEDGSSDIGTFSERSELKTVMLNSSIGEIENLKVSDDYMLSWERIPRFNKYISYYKLNCYLYDANDQPLGFDTYSIERWITEDEVCLCDIRSLIDQSVLKRNLINQALKLKFCLDAYGIISYNGAYYDVEGSSSDSNTVTYICDSDSMKILKLPDNTVVIGEEAFMNSSCEAVIVNDACERIEAGAFGECDKLKYISVSPNTVINKDAFAGSADVVVLYRE